MIEVRKCINLCSEMNDWIDMMIFVPESLIPEAKKIVQKAWNEWNNISEDGTAAYVPYGDYISSSLREAEIDFNVYYLA